MEAINEGEKSKSILPDYYKKKGDLTMKMLRKTIGLLIALAFVLTFAQISVLADESADGSSDGSIDIGKCTIDGFENKTYTGGEITQNIKITYNGSPLTDSQDYSVTYEDNRNAGTATATITGKHYYCGYVKKYFVIEPKTLSSADFVIPSQEYTGKELSPEIKTSLSSSDYNVSIPSASEIGKYDIYIQGKSPNCSGEVTLLFEITPRWITRDMFSISYTTYNGSVQKPVIISKLNMGTDYKATCESAAPVDAGIYAVQIEGLNHYTGSIKKEYVIEKADNPMTVKAKKQTIKKSKIKKKKVIPAKKVFKVSNAQGKVTYRAVKCVYRKKLQSSKKLKGVTISPKEKEMVIGSKEFKKVSKKVTVSPKGAVIVKKKGLKKGAYEMTVEVRAAGNKNYKAGIKKEIVVLKIK